MEHVFASGQLAFDWNAFFLWGVLGFPWRKWLFAENHFKGRYLRHNVMFHAWNIMYKASHLLIYLIVSSCENVKIPPQRLNKRWWIISISMRVMSAQRLVFVICHRQIIYPQISKLPVMFYNLILGSVLSTETFSNLGIYYHGAIRYPVQRL